MTSARIASTHSTEPQHPAHTHSSLQGSVPVPCIEPCRFHARPTRAQHSITLSVLAAPPLLIPFFNHSRRHSQFSYVQVRSVASFSQGAAPAEHVWSDPILPAERLHPDLCGRPRDGAGAARNLIHDWDFAKRRARAFWHRPNPRSCFQVYGCAPPLLFHPGQQGRAFAPARRHLRRPFLGG